MTAEMLLCKCTQIGYIGKIIIHTYYIRLVALVSNFITRTFITASQLAMKLFNNCIKLDQRVP
jgi:hypothetical protein